MQNNNNAYKVAKGIADKMKIKTPRVYEASFPRSNYANIYIVNHSLVYTDACLEHLTEEELATMFAVDLAHLKMISSLVINKKLYSAYILLCLLLAYIGSIDFNDMQDLAITGFSLGIFFILSLLYYIFSRNFRKEFLLADELGVKTIGNKQAFIDGLSKVHRLLYLPDEFPQSVESKVPSLKTRIENVQNLEKSHET